MNAEETRPAGNPEPGNPPSGPEAAPVDPGRGTRPIPLPEPTPAVPPGIAADAPRTPWCCWVAVISSLTSVVLAVLLWLRPAAAPAPVATPAPSSTPPAALVPDGAPEAFQSALRPYLEAARAGDPNAMRMLGAMYYHGLDLPRNRAEGLKWYRKAAESGSQVAKEELRQLE